MAGQLNVEALITHRYNLDDAVTAYGKLAEKSTLGILLDYPRADKEPLNQIVELDQKTHTSIR